MISQFPLRNSGTRLIWQFFQSCHGKGACCCVVMRSGTYDGEGAVVKRALRYAVLGGAHINTAADAVSWLQKHFHKQNNNPSLSRVRTNTVLSRSFILVEVGEVDHSTSSASYPTVSRLRSQFVYESGSQEGLIRFCAIPCRMCLAVSDCTHKN